MSSLPAARFSWFSWFLACLFSPLSVAKRTSLNFWFPLGSLREARGTKYRKSCGENFSFITVPRLLPFPSLRPHLQPHGASQFLPALRNSQPQFTSALRSGSLCEPGSIQVWSGETLPSSGCLKEWDALKFPHTSEVLGQIFHLGVNVKRLPTAEEKGRSLCGCFFLSPWMWEAS